MNSVPQSRTRLAEPSEDAPATPKRPRKDELASAPTSDSAAADAGDGRELPEQEEAEDDAALLQVQAQLSQALSQVRDFCQTSGTSIEALLSNVMGGLASGLPAAAAAAAPVPVGPAKPPPTVLSQGLSFEPVRAPGRPAASGKSGRPHGWRGGCGLGYREFRSAQLTEPRADGADGAAAAADALVAGAGPSSEAAAGGASNGGRPHGWRRGCGLGYREFRATQAAGVASTDAADGAGEGARALAPSAPAARKAMRKRDPSAPPRALSAYFVFMLSKREQLRHDDAQLGADVPRRGTGELTKACAELWRGMDASARAPWEAKAAARKAAALAEAAARPVETTSSATAPAPAVVSPAPTPAPTTPPLHALVAAPPLPVAVTPRPSAETSPPGALEPAALAAALAAQRADSEIHPSQQPRSPVLTTVQTADGERVWEL